MMIQLSTEACIARYGNLSTSPDGGLYWKNAPDWIRPLPVPGNIVLRNYLGKPVYRIFCNTDMHGPLSAAFSALVACGAHLELDTFDGCFHVRWIRGMPGVPSFHSFGVAIDFNAGLNQLGGRGKWSGQFINCMKSAGFVYGGEFSKRPDPMHWELSKIPA
jgi:hypothetical protein